MARAAAGKHKTTKFVFVLVGLLGLFLIVDLLWASSSSPSSNWIVPDSTNIIVPQPVQPNNSAPNTPIKVAGPPFFSAFIQFRRFQFAFRLMGVRISFFRLSTLVADIGYFA